MSTINGFGTRYYGWRHNEDSTATATSWVSLFYLPLIPLRRHSLRVLSDPRSSPVRLRGIGGGALGFLASQTDHYAILGQTPLSGVEIAKTYAKAYILLPLLMAWPLLLVIIFSKIFGPFPHSSAAGPVAMAAAVLTIISVIAWPIWAIRRSRGMSPKLSRAVS